MDKKIKLYFVIFFYYNRIYGQAYYNIHGAYCCGFDHWNCGDA